MLNNDAPMNQGTTKRIDNLQMALQGVDMLKKYVNEAMTLRGTAFVNKGEMLSQLVALENCLPDALTAAQQLLEQRDAILTTAHQDAEEARKMAKDDAQRMLDAAKRDAATNREEGEKQRRTAQQEAERMRKEAEEMRAKATENAQAAGRQVIDAANAEAQRILSAAQQEANRRVSREEVYQQACQEAQTITSQALEDKLHQQQQCQQYASAQLESLDKYLVSVLNDIRRVRNQVRNQDCGA